MISTIFFAFFAGITVFSALAIAFQKNIIFSAFLLLITFLGVASLYILLEADFLAVTQILIYVGGVLVLILFGVLITHKKEKMFLVSGIQYKKRTGFAVISIGCLLSYSVWNEKGLFSSHNEVQNSAHTIGLGLMGKYLLPFELAGVLLLVILIGVLSLSSAVKAQ